MKSAITSTAFLIAISFIASANAQQVNTQSGLRSPAGPYRYTGGWNASTPQNTNDRVQQNESDVVQAAYYQAPGGGIGLPAYPGNDLNAPPNNFANDSSSAIPQSLPAGMPNALPVGQPNPIPNNAMPQNYPPNYQPNFQQVNPPQQFDAYAREPQQVLPPNEMQPPYRTASTDLRAVQNTNQPNPALYNQANNNQTNNSGNDLRPVAPTMQRGFGPEAQRIDVASGYPFVSPPPRTGNYPTSQYNSSLFRPVSYQTVVQSPQAPLSAAVANTQPTLPQYQNQPVGIYPTQYQCPPGTAIYPPPGAVPGTYVPPTLTPNLTPGTYSPNNSGYSPLFSLGQENYNVQIGRGIIGQPTVYVPGQPFRNFIRYLAP